MSDQDILYMVIPAYNEEANVARLVEDWYPVVCETGPRSRMVVVDDGSKDSTYAILQKLAEDRPQLVPLTKPNGGHGDTVLYAYHYALDHGADYIFQTDSDGQTLASEFMPFWQERAGYDLIIGDRSARQDGASRIFVTRVLRAVVRLCFGVFVRDANTPFRLMSAATLKQNLTWIPEHFNLPNVALSAIYVKRKQKVLWRPVTFRPRQGGVNSLNLKKIFRIGVKALKDLRQINGKLSSAR